MIKLFTTAKLILLPNEGAAVEGLTRVNACVGRMVDAEELRKRRRRVEVSR